MIHYHVFFSIKPDVPESTCLGAAKEFLEELRLKEYILRGRLLKNSSQKPKTSLPEYHALFEFKNDEIFNSTLTEIRAEGLEKGPHSILMKSVSEFRVEIFREI